MRAEASANGSAKINLTLHVTGRRPDGYHTLDSLVAFAAVGDIVTVRSGGQWQLTLSGPRAAGVPADDDNLVLRAARLIGGAPATLHLEKHLPTASGIGGGSADAAAALRALHRLDGRPLPRDLLPLGADVPVCLASAPTRMSGIGEILTPVPALPACHVCLVNPGMAVATPDIFAALTERENAPMPDELPAWRDAIELAAWLGHQRNDLELPARHLVPAIGVVLARLAATDGCLLARMSGSGATCFGLFQSAPAAAAAARSLARQHPDWWVADCPLSATPDPA